MKKHISIFLFSLLTISVLAQNNGDSTLPLEDEGRLVLGDTVAHRSDFDWLPSPKKATMLSAALPGAGQIYNKDWWKVPIIYVGLGVIGYSIYWNNDAFVRYQNAYIDYNDDDPFTERYLEIIPKGSSPSDYSNLSNIIENRMDGYRRDRDLLIISMVGFYVLNVIEANVAAHLYDFDVSDDLSLNLSPDMNYNAYNGKATVGMSLRLNINK